MNSKNIKNVFLRNRNHTSAIIIIFMLFLSQGILAQVKKEISGTVFDKTGIELPGVTVIEKGTQNSTITNENGKFSIQVANGSIIEISYMGYTTQSIAISNATLSPLKLTLAESETMLDAVELVSVGYGTMRRSDLTGAISTVTSKDLLKGVMTSTEQSLQGKVAGLVVVQDTGDPSSGSSMRIRGGTSLTASNSPLVVVDGNAGVDINVIQPSDIKTIDVLKDASATAIYGARGANGVIIITTKSGTQDTSVIYNGYSGMSYASNHLDMLSGNQWRSYVRENNIQDAVDYGADTNWQKELEQTAYSQSHSLSVSSASEKGGMRASLTYLDNEGVVKTTGLQRLSGNISGYQYALNKKLKFDTGLFATIDKWYPLDYRIFEREYNLNPTIPVYDQDGNFTAVGGTLYENPAEILANRQVDSKRNRLLGYFKTEYEFLNDFKATVNLNLENNATQGNTYKPTYAVLEGQTEEGYAQKTFGEYTTGQVEAYLNYNKIFGKNSVNAMVGYTYLENIYQGFGAQRSGFVTDFFGYNNLGAGSDYRIGDVYSYKGKSNLVSYFARANYAYDGKYIFTATVRRDGSSRFGANNKWGTFPSAAVAWNITNEDFMEASSGWLNNLKLRISYGVTGNQDGIGEYKSLSILGVGNDSYYDPATDSWSLAYSPTQNANPDLKWESTAQTNIGLDFTLFKGLSGSFEYYSKLTSDLLYTYEVPQPPYLVGTMLANVGDLSNKGYEITLNGDIINKEKFTLSANLTFAHNDQKIEKLSNDLYGTNDDGTPLIVKSGSLHGLAGMSGQFSQIIAEGYPVGTFWGYECYGLDENGEFILSEEEGVIGDVEPDFSIGFGVNMTYHNFDFGFTANGLFGQQALNATNMMLYDPNRLPAYNVPDDFLDSGITSPPTYSSYWIEDASFLRLQTVTLGYTLPIKSASSIRIYVLGQNLGVLTNYSGVDPEVNLTGLANPGIDRFNNYPRPTTVSFGMNITLK